ncbi:ribosome inactivating protein Euserratin 2 precursor [Canna indica]|uniref:rRNA N-glycosylase n=1 Tax=Canna indica TaxID=4628 RepID=A0AAQ3JU03_9LILI|nr:ribosome inactivating protein Euserratin 2 precursor [Canna indica]
MKMKLWILVVATWLFCWSSTRVESLSQVCPKKKQGEINYNNNLTLSYKTLTFEIKQPITGSNYIKFLDDLRDAVKSDDTSYGFPILCEKSKVLQGKEYVLVEVNDARTENRVTVTLVISVVNLYLIGYKAASTAYFFKGEYENVKDNKNLFPNTQRIKLNFDGSYTALGDSRSDLPIGIPALGNAIAKLHRYGEKGVSIKPSLIVVIETISEAARFRRIQDEITGEITQSIKPSLLSIAYENNWGDLSTQIQKADPKTKKFEKAIELYGNGTIIKTINNVGQVGNDIAILNYKKGKLNRESIPMLAGDHHEEEWLFAI